MKQFPRESDGSITMTSLKLVLSSQRKVISRAPQIRIKIYVTQHILNNTRGKKPQ